MRGIFYMLIAIALLGGMDATAKWLMLEGVSAMQILVIRSAIILPLMLLVYRLRNELPTLKPKRPDLHLWRGCIGFISPLAFFIGIEHIPLTDAIVLFFSSVFIVTILSVLFLQESVGTHRWISIIVGFIGVLIVATPQGGGDIYGYLLVLLGSATYSMVFVSGRYLSATETVASLVFSFNFCVGVISLILVPWFWEAIQLNQLLWLVVLALLAVSGHFCITMAFATSEATLVAPFEYSAIIWAMGFDLLLWNTVPTQTTMIGAAIIMSSGLYIVHRERLKNQPTVS
ncbi:MAG: drug/metabolite transporter (DMT)-like permease [Gammaproteobacteria bacterium]|jgi:drug/metabolite transporter (DMT)-like permease